MSDEMLKKKTLVEAVREALAQEGKDEGPISEKLQPVKRRKLRTTFAILSNVYAYGTWVEGITLLEFAPHELHGVMINNHFSQVRSATAYVHRRTSTGGRLYEPKMKALKRVLQ